MELVEELGQIETVGGPSSTTDGYLGHHLCSDEGRVGQTDGVKVAADKEEGNGW